MSATSIDLVAIKSDATSYAASFRALIGLDFSTAGYDLDVGGVTGSIVSGTLLLGTAVALGGQLRAKATTDTPAIIAQAYAGTANAFEAWDSLGNVVASVSNAGALAVVSPISVTGVTDAKLILTNVAYSGQVCVDNAVGVSLGRRSGKGIALFNSCSPISVDVGGNITYPDGNSSLGESGWRWGGVWTTTANVSEYMQMTEMTAPSAPSTNGVRIFAEDNGSGKTRLMARFATGAAVQIAIEP